MADDETVGETTRLLNGDSQSYVVTNTEIQNQAPRVFVQYTRRWFILVVVCILNLSNAMIWLSFSPVADKTASFYNVDASAVNWLSLVFPIATLPFGFVASWMLDTLGLRFGIVGAAWVNAIGASVRVVSAQSVIPAHWRFPLVLVGQVLPACAQPFLMFAPTKVAALWFSDTQRASANMLSSMSNPLGILLANVIAPLIAKSAHQIPLLMILTAIPAALGVMMATFGVCNSVPPTPPTASAAEISEPFVSGLKKLVRDKTYWILAFCFGGGVALFTTLTTMLEQILCARGYSDSFAGLCGALLIGLGLVGAAVAGVYVDRTKKFEEVAKLSYGLAAVALLLFTVICRYPNQDVLVIVSISLFGLFGFALYPICLELAVECTYPVAEATSSGLLIMSGQLQGIIFILLMQVTAQPLTGADISRQTCGSSQSGITPQDFTYPNIGLSVLTTLTAVLFITAFRARYKRLQTEQQLAAERILNVSRAQMYNEFF